MGQDPWILVKHTHKGCCLPQLSRTATKNSELTWNSSRSHSQPCFGTLLTAVSQQLRVPSCNSATPALAGSFSRDPNSRSSPKIRGEWQHKHLFPRTHRTSEAEQGIFPTFPRYQTAPIMGLAWSPEPNTARGIHCSLENPSVHELQLQGLHGKANRTQILCF